MNALTARIVAANPDFTKSDREIVAFLAPMFWKQDNPQSNFREPPSVVYEVIEGWMPEARKAALAA